MGERRSSVQCWQAVKAASLLVSHILAKRNCDAYLTCLIETRLEDVLQRESKLMRVGIWKGLGGNKWPVDRMNIRLYVAIIRSGRTLDWNFNINTLHIPLRPTIVALQSYIQRGK